MEGFIGLRFFGENQMWDQVGYESVHARKANSNAAVVCIESLSERVAFWERIGIALDVSGLNAYFFRP